METKLLKVHIVNNEWYFTHDGINIISPPMFVDAESSAIIGENVNVEAADTEQELLDRIITLNLTSNDKLE